jgi:hypothetical protein
MQTAEEKRFIDRTDFRVRKEGENYCPHTPPKNNIGTLAMLNEKIKQRDGEGLQQVLRVQYELLLLKDGEKNFSPCPYNSKINSLDHLAGEEITNREFAKIANSIDLTVP